MNYNNTEQVFVNDEVGVDEAGVQTGIEGALFGEVADTEAGGAEMGSGRGIEAHEDSAEEDCGPKRVAPDHGMPMQWEFDDHNVDHLPFRLWCVSCAEGKATGEQHRSDGPEGQISRFAFDYMFVTRPAHPARRADRGGQEEDPAQGLGR